MCRQARHAAGRRAVHQGENPNPHALNLGREMFAEVPHFIGIHVTKRDLFYTDGERLVLCVPSLPHAHAHALALAHAHHLVCGGAHG
eukprot:2490026-Pleurochrysis_carterae.AAC.1